MTAPPSQMSPPPAPSGTAARRAPLDRLRPRLCRPGRPWEVTTFDPAREVDPRLAGMTREGVAAIWAAVERLYATGLHPAITLCLRRAGRVVIDRAIGHARGNGPDAPPGAEGGAVLARPDTPFTIFSASKAITAVVVHLLDQRRLIHLDDAVAEYLPAFADRRKRWITIRHVLTHRAGIPTIPGREVDLDLLARPERIIELLADAEPVWRPGRRLAYHALTGGFVLGEVVRRVTGRDIGRVLREELLDPLGGFPTMAYGARGDAAARLAENAFTGFAPPFPLSLLVKRALGVAFEDACRYSNDPRFLGAIVPAGNLAATADEVSRFFEMLLRGGELDGRRVLDARTVRRALAEQSYYEVDLTLGVPIRHGLGLMLGGRLVSPFGPDTRRAFGHLGFTNVFAWADPERDLAASLMTSGKPILAPGLWRVWDVLRAIGRACPRAS